MNGPQEPLTGTGTPAETGAVRSALEPLLFVGLALLFVWIVRPTDDDRLKIPALVVIVAIPFASVYLHRDRLRELGLRLDNLGRSALEVGLFTVAAALAVIAIGVLAGDGFRPWPGWERALLLYPFWGLAQQFAMQSFSYRRLREAAPRPPLVAALTAFLFAIVHYPNLALTGVTFVGGFCWCLLFQRRPNLITLAISHGWLAVLLRGWWPAEWLHNLRIGPGYWTWTG